MKELYKENILDHYSYPRNKGKLESPDILVKDSNPLCGDVVEFSISMDNGKVKEVMFDGKGCAISVAAASILSDFIKGKKVGDVLNIDKDDLLKILGIDPSPTRLKCVLLPLEVVKVGMKMYKAQLSSTKKPKVRFVRENEDTH
ncbi:SUF system NifU family Fe-S cluster assembly protein [archaeon]|nr:MAG: SUF system NifU family Fe-S cluster assembly protein [archaeon]